MTEMTTEMTTETKTENNDGNDASRSGSNGAFFDPIMMPWSHGGGSQCNIDGIAAAERYIIYKCHIIYLPYKDPIKDVPLIAVCKF